MSPDHLQPGDPEIRIAAPADARSVVVFFPFGETKVARYERAHKAWTVRFLVEEVCEGTVGFTAVYGNTLMGLAAAEPVTETVSALRAAPDAPEVVLLTNEEDAEERTRLTAAGATWRRARWRPCWRAPGGARPTTWC